MAGLTHTIGSSTFQPVGFSNGPRLSLGCFALSASYDIKRFHPPGVDGRFVVRAGRNGGRVVAFLAYLATENAIVAAYNDDAIAWENTAVIIKDSAGRSITRCQLDDGGMNVTKHPISIGRANLCYMEAVATFTRDS